ncbi:MAG: hypothetical protein JST04_01500 [Bdellovibrionales bacterium]|nr:hypothetical protein [Bdellovibrionales bacterium]
MSRKLHALGALLERQGAEHEGFTELAGLGIVLSELSERLEGMSVDLDEHLAAPILTQEKTKQYQQPARSRTGDITAPGGKR